MSNFRQHILKGVLSEENKYCADGRPFLGRERCYNGCLGLGQNGVGSQMRKIFGHAKAINTITNQEHAYGIEDKVDCENQDLGLLV